ncbi:MULTISPECIES: DUF4307 domain-containing protein [Pseudarthrobacter]|uniref:DUF4307 domain-containing protein n=1 Tax=Pseudarthrobacter niigatensis TaxID=369935 RepID=A0AAJ1SXV1_9MICC|nr:MULTISPECIES: DUF4307 domain-containing protein [Pseudarthrobacter]MDQ0146721.1 hypothetical protein [Pseudarthrobacter niigatensis]MDQ0264733.1 hypothetical protein [Pseudarthrobacter niigatensis]QDG64301.1 DUF4307 domain-containing protein [Pseudarthrobacter sp. NIBRBAC000502771]QDG87642.1 DUF4307 domain-containing protein [Pseudarthrobacter sp. NIBRBAC000502770]
MTSPDQPAQSAPADTSLANRYGAKKRRLSPKAARTAIGAALVVGIGFLAWVTTSNSLSGVTYKDVGYSTTDATLAEVDFQVTREPANPVKCAVKALDSKFAVVGWKVVDIPPSAADRTADGGRTVAQRVTLRTESASVSGVVDSCWIPAGAS